MDINTIIGGSTVNSRTLVGKSPKLFVQDRKSFAEKICDWSTDAVLSVKRDPAVLEAKVAFKEQVVSDFPKILQATKKHERIQERNTDENKHRVDFENKMCMEQASLLSLSSNQLSLLLKYVETLRTQRMSLQKKMECGFCKNNRHPEVWYTTHALKDGRGRVRCPILRSFICPRCGATGDRAHTIKHCPRRN